MKKTILILLLLLTFKSMHAQDRKDKIKALKIAFLTEQLELTQEEAQKFWPVYNTFEAEIRKLKSLEYKIKKTEDWKTLSEEEASTTVDNLIKNEEISFTLKKQFLLDLKKILPSKKIIKLKASEHAFNRRMLEQFKNRKAQKQ
ncbi:MAG TPA: hypothetical protein VFF15_03990 [Flavobacteriaceae bacterium]|nr:hypothetical protein [Flavobacteriaceae bacterium]